MRFLIGEYSGCLQRVVAGALRSIGYGVDVATSDSELRSFVVTIDYEVIILDTNLPGGEATVSEVVRDLRRDGFRIPILVVSGNGGVDQLVKILDSGVDDCLVKAFNTREMLARVRALLRRPPSVQESILRLGNMECDAAASEVRCLGRPIDLKRKERRLLTILLRSNGRVVPKELLVTMLSEWSNEVSVNAIEALVSRLRKRLRAVQSGVAINTVHGTGYRLIRACTQLAPWQNCPSERTDSLQCGKR